MTPGGPANRTVGLCGWYGGLVVDQDEVDRDELLPGQALPADPFVSTGEYLIGLLTGSGTEPGRCRSHRGSNVDPLRSFASM